MQVDQHTILTLLALAKNRFQEVNWEFSLLSVSEQVIVGNQINLNIIKKYSHEGEEKCKQ